MELQWLTYAGYVCSLLSIASIYFWRKIDFKIFIKRGM